MPPKCKFTKEEIVTAALEITRKEGIRSVTARAVGEKLHSSSKVIFGLFQNMEELQRAVILAADAIYQSFIEEDMTSGKYPPYKGSGMAYIRFAREERELFKLLFMRDRSGEKISENTDAIKPLIQLLQKNMGLSEAQARMFHLEMWIYVHGIATMIATAYLEWDVDFISQMLTDAYQGLKQRYVSAYGEE
jgi:AcrR family transcriptional regulator